MKEFITFIKISCVLLAMIFCISCKEGNPSLLISDGTLFEPGNHFPDFRWDHTPQYFMFGTGERLLTQKEVQFISGRTGFICIEKSHGLKPLGAAELGAKHECSAFKSINPGTKVLFYFNSAWAWPFTSYNKHFTPDSIEAHPELKKFLLINPETGELNHRGNTFSFDVLNPEFRKWWVETVVEGVSVSGCDGVFVDQMHGFHFLRPEKKEEVLKAMGYMMADLKSRLGPDKILLANNGNDEIARYVFPHIDASMFEHYNSKLTEKENLLKEWDDMLKNAKEGKISVFRIGVELDYTGNATRRTKEYNAELETVSNEKLEYYLSCYLIGAQPYSYFQYGWGWDLSEGSLTDYPELSRPLGAPEGAYKRVDADSWEFTREFEHASVWVDTEKKESKITWR